MVVFCRQSRLVSAIPLEGGRLAQLVEQLTLNQRVDSSNLSAPTTETEGFRGFSKLSQNSLSAKCRQEMNFPNPKK